MDNLYVEKKIFLLFANLAVRYKDYRENGMKSQVSHRDLLAFYDFLFLMCSTTDVSTAFPCAVVASATETATYVSRSLLLLSFIDFSTFFAV